MCNIMVAGWILMLLGVIYNAASNGQKKSQKEAKALETAHNHVGLTFKRLITPVKYSSACLIHPFQYLL